MVCLFSYCCTRDFTVKVLGTLWYIFHLFFGSLGIAIVNFHNMIALIVNRSIISAKGA